MQISPTTRLVGVDAARAIAIAGMMWVHTGGGEYDTFLTEIPSGNSSLLFALIAGVSLGLVTRRDIPLAEKKLRLVGRAMGLFVVSFALSWLASPIAIIIGYYGLWFLLAPLFIGWSVRTLLVVAGVMALVGPALSLLVEWAHLNFGAYSDPGPNNLLLVALFTGIYPGVMYLVPVLVGLAVFRTGMARWWWLVGCAATILGFGGGWAIQRVVGQVATDGGSSSVSDPELGSWKEESAEEAIANLDASHQDQMEQLREIAARPDIETAGQMWDVYYNDGSLVDSKDVDSPLWGTLGELISTEGHAASSFALVGGVGLGLMVLMALVVLCRLAWVALVLRPVVAMGAMPLTAYCLHVALVAFFESTMSFGVLTLIVVAVCFALSFIRKRGPLEWAVGKAATAYAR